MNGSSSRHSTNVSSPTSSALQKLSIPPLWHLQPSGQHFVCSSICCMYACFIWNPLWHLVCTEITCNYSIGNMATHAIRDNTNFSQARYRFLAGKIPRGTRTVDEVGLNCYSERIPRPEGRAFPTAVALRARGASRSRLKMQP